MTREQQALIFAMWVAEQVCREDFESESFPELACRRLHRLGIVKRKDGNWTFDPNEYEWDGGWTTRRLWIRTPTTTKMDDLISRQAVLEEIDRASRKYAANFFIGLSVAADIVAKQPAATRPIHGEKKCDRKCSYRASDGYCMINPKMCTYGGDAEK